MSLTSYEPTDGRAWQAFAQLNFELAKLARRKGVILSASRKVEAIGSVKDWDRPTLPPTSCDECRKIGALLCGFDPPCTTKEHDESDCMIFNEDLLLHCVCEAVKGFLHCIRSSKDTSRLNTFTLLLRVLNIWFETWDYPPLNSTIQESVDFVPVGAWVLVVPQLLSRLSLKRSGLLPCLKTIFSRLIVEAPEALVYSIGVSAESPNPDYSIPAESLLEEFQLIHPRLVEESLCFIRGMKQAAITVQETWCAALEKGAKNIGDSNAYDESTAKLLWDAYEALESAQPSPALSGFLVDFAQPLAAAQYSFEQWTKTRESYHLHNMWNFFHEIHSDLWDRRYRQSSVPLEELAPEVAKKIGWILRVPGQDDFFERRTPTIYTFLPNLKILKSKQRPRFFELLGSDGNRYGYLLKGREDLRQDQTATQVLQFLDQLISCTNSSQPSRYVSPFVSISASLVLMPGSVVATGASVPRFTNQFANRMIYPAVLPLSDSVGIIQWLQGADTLHTLVSTYRKSLTPPRSVNVEIQYIKNACPDFEVLPALAKVNNTSHSSITQCEIFTDLQEKTTSEDIRTMLLWQARHSPDLLPNGLTSWFRRRTEFSRSLGIMSIFGYILGLGDRHPSNIMIDRKTGGVIHVDFGDCFDIALFRPRFPERVPFRLTRMLVEALGPAGHQGAFRNTCVKTQEVVRANSEFILSIIDTFLFDPLTSFKSLLPHVEDLRGCLGCFHDDEISLNHCAQLILEQADTKLTGSPSTTVEQQVDALIAAATDILNLSQAFPGWCSFW